MRSAPRIRFSPVTRPFRYGIAPKQNRLTFRINRQPEATAMTAKTENLSEVSGVRRYDIPKLELRRRSDEHPMAMFGLIVAAAFLSMGLLSVQAPAEAAVSAPTIELSGEPLTTGKSARLPLSEKQRACQGQAWGAESMDCLLMIARESKGESRKIRLVLADHINSSTPNVF
jgi:hypothetical protein